MTKHDHGPDEDPPYVPPEATIAALQEVALLTIHPEAIMEAQKTCVDTKAHMAGNLPKKVKVALVDMSGASVLCEVSETNNPRPLVPASMRNLIVNLLHHTDHPSIKETTKRLI